MLLDFISFRFLFAIENLSKYLAPSHARVPPSGRRFAFVEFENEDDAKEALDSLNNSEIDGRTIRLEFSQNVGQKSEGGRGGSGTEAVTVVTLILKGRPVTGAACSLVVQLLRPIRAAVRSLVWHSCWALEQGP